MTRSRPRKARPWIVPLVLGVAAGVAACGPDAAVPDPSRVADELRPRVRIVGAEDPAHSLVDRMEHHHVPGASLAVIDDHRVVWARGFGVREHGRDAPVDTTTRFQAGSISKPVFASGALRLVEEGQLSLEADVTRFLNSWSLPRTRFTEDRDLTLRHLLSHTGGLTVHGFPGYPIDVPLPTVPEILDGTGAANTGPVRSDTIPGARFTYSGGGYTVAQLMATDVTGERFPELMRRRVLEPAGMSRSTFENPPPDVHARHAASGHEAWDTPLEGRFHVYPEMAAAGLWTTATDLARWAIAVSRSYRGEGGLLSPETAREMLTPQVELPGGDDPSAGWGLGPVLADSGEAMRFTHGGRNMGFVATMSMWPASGQGLVVMTNGTSDAFLAEVERAFGAVYGLPIAPRVERRVASRDPGELTGLAGRYASGGTTDRVVVEVRREGDVLRVEVPGLVRGRLYPEEGSDAFFDSETGTSWRFERPGDDSAEAATRLHMTLPGSEGAVVAERVERRSGDEDPPS